MRQIIYAWNYREWGGAQIYALSLMKQANRSYSVSAVIPSDSDARILQYLAALDIPIEFTDPAPPVISPTGFFDKIAHRVKVVRSENRLVGRILSRRNLEATIVHIDLGFWQSFVALLRLCKKTNLFVTQHTALVDPGGVRGLVWRAKGKLLSRSTRFRVIASNNDAKYSLKPFLTPAKFDEIEITYSGFDPDEIAEVARSGPSREDIRRQYSLCNTGPLLTAVGQFIERKGCWVLLESLRKLKDDGEQFSFVWLATTIPDDDTANRIDEHGLGDMFRLLGSEEIGPTRKELLSLLRVADVFVLASFREGLPIALVEAMALGVPCIATRVGAIPEAIDDDASGILVTPGDPNQLAEAIKQLLHDPETRKMFGKAARSVASEKFDQQKTAERTLRLYDNVWKTTAWQCRIEH